jgi:hypothetical protein
MNTGNSSCLWIAGDPCTPASSLRSAAERGPLHSARTLAFVLGLALAGACSAEKSANPLSPAVAGPIPGVNITAPRPMQPAAGVTVNDKDQPIRLVVENATTNGQRALFYLFEVASDSEFKTKLFAVDNVPPGDNGRTQVTLRDKLAANRKYYWRSRAADGANTGPFAGPVAFDVIPPAAIGAPVALDPINDARTPNRRPNLSVRNGEHTGPVGNVTYSFEVARDQAFANVVYRVNAGEGNGGTTAPVVVDLDGNQRYFWRARASDGQATSPWSATASFQTPADAPSPGPAPSPSPGGGGNANCAPPYPSNGPAVINCVEAKYPQYLVAGVSVNQRKANMAFLRDRVIEIGICGGMNLAWNMKRGGPEKSIDFIAWHDGRQWIGVDIGRAYDDVSKKLDLVWGIHGPTPDARTYEPRPTCQ